AGKFCFLCDDEAVEAEVSRIGCCPHCSPPVKIGSRIPDILNHNAAHILFDPATKIEHQPCGLCLRPAPQCTFILKGSSPDFQVDAKKTNCPVFRRFKYSSASSSEKGNPSSNVPLPCPASACKVVVWKYNLEMHFKTHHPGLERSVYATEARISGTEKGLLRAIWDQRHSKKQRKSKAS
ncbi:hypothetical protein K438DRAFT_1443999, partial [Mycena galopus ATCC 62051]